VLSNWTGCALLLTSQGLQLLYLPGAIFTHALTCCRQSLRTAGALPLCCCLAHVSMDAAGSAALSVCDMSRLCLAPRVVLFQATVDSGCRVLGWPPRCSVVVSAVAAL
jgi:hypothetical protein